MIQTEQIVILTSDLPKYIICQNVSLDAGKGMTGRLPSVR
jgi:hypothetical protein